MAQPSALGSVSYEAESSFAESTSTAATLRVPHLESVDISGFIQKIYAPGRVQQYLSAGDSWIRGEKEGTFKTKTYLMGHGSTTAGATTITAYETWMGKIFGNAAVVAAAGTTLTGGTATVPLTTSSGAYSAGGLCFIGTLGDAKGNGQAYAIATSVGTSLTLLTDLTGSPANGNLCSSGTMIYPFEQTSTSTVASLRFLVKTASMQICARGCAPTDVKISGLGPGGKPTLDVTWQCASWDYRADAFPDTTSTDANNPSVVAAGSLFVNAKGTSTSALRTVYDFTMDLGMGMEILRGSGGANANQTIVGYVRTPQTCKVSWVEDSPAATTSPTVPAWTTARHVLLTASIADGSRLAFYFPNVCPADPYPVQFIDQNMNRLRFTGMAYTNTVTTNDLTLSAWRMLSA